jgi:hypothetical protein
MTRVPVAAVKNIKSAVEERHKKGVGRDNGSLSEWEECVWTFPGGFFDLFCG